MKSDFYIIEATVRVSHKVHFEEPVTFDEARQMFLNEEYDEISDEDPLEVVSVERVQQVEISSA